MSGGSGNRTEKGGKRVDINGIKVRTENRTLENTSGRGERRRRVIGKKDGYSDSIEEMSRKRKERKRSTRRSKSMPDDLTIDGIISGLDIQESNDGMMIMLEKVSMHKFM